MAWRKVYVAAGALGAVALLAVLALVGFWQFWIAPSAVSFTVSAPARVRVGEEFPMVIELRNESDSEVVIWTGVEFGDDFGVGSPGLSVLRSEPPYRGEDYESGSTIFEFDDVEIPPLSERRAVFTLRAETAGTFEGQIHAMTRGRRIPMNFPTVGADVRVRAEQ